jgi:uncharacterized membrane protein
VGSRADLALCVAGFGILLLLEGRRKAGLASILLGAAYTLLAVMVVQPHFGDGGYAHIDSFATYGDTPVEVGWGLLTSPLQVLEDLTVEQNFTLIVFLLAPVFFLPVLAPRYLLPVVPLELLYLIADVEMESTFREQTVAITAFVFVATAFALAKIGRQGVERVIVDRRVLGALVLVSTVFFVRDAASSPYRHPWAWGGRDSSDQARLDAVDLIGDDQSVRASPALVPLLAERSWVYVLDTTGRPDVRTAISTSSDGEAAGSGEPVDAVILDHEAAPDWSENEHRVFREGLVRQGYERTFAEEGVEVYVLTS